MRIPSARICGTLLRSASGLVVTLLALACTRSICKPGSGEVEVDAINLDAGNIGGGTPQTRQRESPRWWGRSALARCSLAAAGREAAQGRTRGA